MASLGFWVRTLTLGLLVATNAAAQSWPLVDDAEIASRLNDYVHTQRLAPGVVLTIVERHASPQRRIRTWSVGSSGAATVSLDADTVFEIGSITKGFTGLLLAEMVNRGEVELDASLEGLRADAELPETLRTLTLRQLGQHRSGLPRLSLRPGDLARVILADDPYARVTVADIWDAAGATPGRKPPGDFEYSNLGYSLLGQALARHAGRDYGELLRERVLQPYGLTELQLARDAVPPGRLAQGHRSNLRPAAAWSFDGYAPAGALLASSRQLAHFLEQIQTEPPASWQTALDPAVRHELGPNRQIGLGWMVRGGEMGPLIWHNGGTGGFRTFLGYLPQQDIGLIVLTNGSGDADALALSLLDRSRDPPRRAPWTWLDLPPLLGLVLAPIMLLMARPRPRGRPVDWLDTGLAGAMAFFLLALAERLGPWERVPFALWWVSLGVSVGLMLVVLRDVRQRPLRQGPRWSQGLRAVGTLVFAGMGWLLI